MKQNQHVKPVVDVESRTVTFQTKGHPDIVLHMDRLHPDIRDHAAMVGMAQVRIVDAAAVSVTGDDGKAVPTAQRIALKHERMARLVEHYETGTAQWSLVTPGAGAETGLTLRAIAQVIGGDYAAAQQHVERWSKSLNVSTQAVLASFRAKPGKVRDAYATLRDEAAKQSGINTDELLEEIENLDFTK